ncbi:MAG: class I SAM-dependent methyltransferase [Actinobacteria bacterium]|nr:class I SAM-dependent methyltransferase [Actinomycetota bacterium]NDD72973.1 class I SAM-dependent methyltransferase [Actinomycetota bacterium]
MRCTCANSEQIRSIRLLSTTFNRGANLKTDKTETNEAQYGELIDQYKSQVFETFGLMHNYTWKLDPRRMLFAFARYKFVAKMFDGYERVLEVGCGDASATRIVQQNVGKVVVIDFDKTFIDDINSRQQANWELDARVHDMVQSPVLENFDGIFSLDVLEHIEKQDEENFLKNICASLSDHGSLIIGIPSLESQTYASDGSKAGHVNCKSGNELRDFLKKYFHSVFMFSMNDEVLHTGFFPMSHYLLAVCAEKKLAV